MPSHHRHFALATISNGIIRVRDRHDMEFLFLDDRGQTKHLADFIHLGAESTTARVGTCRGDGGATDRVGLRIRCCVTEADVG